MSTPPPPASSWQTTIPTLVALVLGAIGVGTSTSAEVQAVVAAGMALVVAVHALVALLAKQSTNKAAVLVKQAAATTATANAQIATLAAQSPPPVPIPPLPAAAPQLVTPLVGPRHSTTTPSGPTS